MARGKKQKQEPEPVEELKDAAEEVAAEVVAAAVEEPEAEAPAATEDAPEDAKASNKRKADAEVALSEEEEAKRNKTIDAALIAEALASDAADTNTELVLPAKDGVENFTDSDVLSGRGGGTVSFCFWPCMSMCGAGCKCAASLGPEFPKHHRSGSSSTHSLSLRLALSNSRIATVGTRCSETSSTFTDEHI